MRAELQYVTIEYGLIQLCWVAAPDDGGRRRVSGGSDSYADALRALVQLRERAGAATAALIAGNTIDSDTAAPGISWPCRPRADREVVQQILRERDQRKQVQLFPGTITPVHEQVGELWQVMRGAELSEPEIAAQCENRNWLRASSEVFHLLWVDRGWTVGRYGQWLADPLERLLLP
jgi:hypothetical protein